MSDVCRRFEAIRGYFGLSMRAMSIELGLSNSGWAAYESGKAMPSFDVLNALRKRGISIDWLLDGSGSMREAANNRSNEPDFVQDAEERFLAGLRLGRMVLSASLGTVTNRGAGLDLIMSSDKKGLTLAEINAALKIDFRPMLLQLIEEGIVHRLKGDLEERFIVSEQTALTKVTEQDKGQAGVEAVEFLARKVIPATHEKPSRGIYLKANVHVQDPYEFIRETKRFLAEKSASTPEARTDLSLVTILFGACIE